MFVDLIVTSVPTSCIARAVDRIYFVDTYRFTCLIDIGFEPLLSLCTQAFIEKTLLAPLFTDKILVNHGALLKSQMAFSFKLLMSFASKKKEPQIYMTG